MNKIFVKAKCPHCRVTKSCCILCGVCVQCAGCRPFRCTNGIPARYAGTTFVRNPLRRVLGIEYEIAQFNDSLQGTLQRFVDNEGIARLRLDRDSSVHPSESEWITHPITGDDALSVLTYMADLLNRSKSAVVNETCGYHVHVDACKESSYAIRKFLFLYLKMEGEIYSRLCAPERAHRDYCAPLTNLVRHYFPDFKVEQLRDMPKAIDFTNFVMRLYGLRTEEGYDIAINRKYWRRLAADRHAFGYQRELNPRYAGLNIHAWYKQGSIEWRMKEMTIRYTCPEDNDLLYWPLFCGWFTHSGLGMRMEDINAINSLQEFADAVLMPEDVTAWLRAKLAQAPRDPIAPPPPPQPRAPNRPRIPHLVIGAPAEANQLRDMLANQTWLRANPFLHRVDARNPRLEPAPPEEN